MPTKSVEPIITEHSAEWHWWAFSDFCKLKKAVSEPSPHMQMIGLLTKDKSLEEKIWFCGLYAAFYNIPSALAMWKEWPWEAARINSDAIVDWLRINWKGVFTRIERRTVRTPERMAECIQSYVAWAKDTLPRYLAYPATDDPDTNALAYDVIWQQSDKELRYMGRYIIIRLLESLHRFCGLQPHLYDIRSIGGWSPKRALGLLYPEHMDLLLSPDTKANILKVDALAYGAMERFSTEYDIDMSPYVFAAMLCEYRVAYEKRHQYAGWTLSQEPAYWDRIKPYWLNHRGTEFVEEIEMNFFQTRKDLFSEACLGELNGWSDKRSEPPRTLRDYGYTWCDLKFDYWKTKEAGNFSEPVLKHG